MRLPWTLNFESSLDHFRTILSLIKKIFNPILCINEFALQRVLKQKIWEFYFSWRNTNGTRYDGRWLQQIGWLASDVDVGTYTYGELHLN